jgi:hypothetical protein
MFNNPADSILMIRTINYFWPIEGGWIIHSIFLCTVIFFLARISVWCKRIAILSGWVEPVTEPTIGSIPENEYFCIHCKTSLELKDDEKVNGFVCPECGKNNPPQ